VKCETILNKVHKKYKNPCVLITASLSPGFGSANSGVKGCAFRWMWIQETPTPPPHPPKKYVCVLVFKNSFLSCFVIEKPWSGYGYEYSKSGSTKLGLSS
jgi:hypothetical protein